MEQAMREEFEANAKVRWSTDYDDFGDGLFSIQADGRYEYEHIQWDWETWQASRAALRVELPFPIIVDEGAEFALHAYDKDETDKALQQAGIEVK
ncbi:hypothetical protein OFL75_31800 [Pseudomonas aeruginosa]|uniref:hypothetical protein n=1 Tax=Pseudomonas aeruginosa group TaxID=136841 RepID=UPI001872BC3B|nr:MULTISPECIES: hypothetical protein [Pseudomonas aeruginosa group]EKW2387226.1 hypothetical protein [Pseudomonas aeruginosa]MBW6276238.1 hypothetical protein [Pseudomonas aeruginosa]MCF1244955.1 hypothetical protein [Pseudomonas aeruginosa]MCF1245199.1 hypothetical protein [Pseudomonas aeruginosa]MCV6108203.1 hypothetical protein [Pseudomonas aeruginosa]